MKTIQDIFDEINEQQLSLVNQFLTPNEMRGIFGFKPYEENTLYEISKPQFSLVKTPDTNCPNCGAPRQGLSCEYCGTVFISDCSAEQQRQMVQSIVPYGFNPMTNTSQCCCSIQDSIQRQYDLQQCSATFY